MPINVAFVNNQEQCGGAETVMWQLHRGLLEQGQHSTVYVDEYDRQHSVTHRKGLYPALLDRLDHSRFHSFVRRFAPRERWTDAAFRRLAESEHGIIHIHNFHGTYATVESLAALAARKPVIWTFHRFWGITGGCDHPAGCSRYLDSCGACPLVHEWPMNGLDNTARELERKARVLGPLPLWIVAPSLHLAEKVRNSRVGKNWKVVHIPNGVDCSQFQSGRKHSGDFRRGLGLDPEKITVLVVNRNFRDPLKGFDTIEAALRELLVSNIQVVLAGAEADWAVSILPARHSAVAAGYVAGRARLADFYEAADIFLYASPRENFPCVILEAMAAECCVVATPTDGVIEQIEHNRSGLLACDFDGNSLATVLQQAVADADLRASLGSEGRRRAINQFSQQRMVDAHLELYRKVIDEN